MQRYIIIRLIQSVFTLIGVSIIVFSLARLSGNPLDVLLPDEADDETFIRISELWGLNDPWYVQYFTFVKNASRGEFGPSFKWQGRTAMELVILHLPATLQLAVVSIGVSVLLAVPIGVMSAVKKGTMLDTIGKLIALLGQSLPSFWLAIVLIWIFAVQLGWFPTSGRGGISNMVLPAVALGWFSVASFMRLTRSSMLNVLDSEYIKLARIKGLPEWKVVWKHGLKNAAIPPLTVFGAIVVGQMTGSVTIETVFAWPGVGLLALQAVNARDYQVIQAVTMFISVLFIGMNLLIDILYAYIDPRIRFS
ncbi:MAG: ABC transporter permease [Chloroflexota bacterium]|nr:ABC transporter permease [Chloroflexota bacterium]MDE2968786.1 ABC transporter permease [Chloroflexota bacterium]